MFLSDLTALEEGDGEGKNSGGVGGRVAQALPEVRQGDFAGLINGIADPKDLHIGQET